MTTTPTFLSPKSRQFPFDEACEQIVRALHARNFKVPGFEVNFRDYGSGEMKFRYVDSVKNDALDVKLKFCRVQDNLGRWNDVAAVHTIQARKMSLDVYDDESGPTLCVYVGDDWERDRNQYWTRFNAQLDRAPRRCLRYKGEGHYRGRRNQLMMCERDSREYQPVEPHEPFSYDAAKVMDELRAHLVDVVLPAIEAHPIADAIDDVCALPAPIPVPDNFGPLFTYVDYSDASRIQAGRKDQGELSPDDRYGVRPCWRLAPIDIKSGPDMPEVAYDGFVWCVGPTPRVPSELRADISFYKDQLVKITLKDARGVFVAEHAAYEKRRAELSNELVRQRRDHFTNSEINDFVRARACTIIPITEYKEGFEIPVYLINRELDLDEVEFIGKCEP